MPRYDRKRMPADERTTSLTLESDSVESLVHEVVRVTGVELPSLMDDSSPTFAPQDGGGFYLIGLIGGKDVGKSTLANAIAGVALGTPSNTGEGTRSATAYVHRFNEVAVRAMLDAAVPGRFELVVHEHASLRSQVLVDLPDIDSKYQDHVDLTRSMLRHLLFPVFVQSIEKYADQRPQQLLAQVAQGNDPANFIFCLTKIDQLVAREGAGAATTLAADYATRLRRLLDLSDAPRVHCVSAFQPDDFDLPALRRTLSRDRDPATVERSLALAAGRRKLTLLQWAQEQRLDQRLARANRTLGEARALAEDKLLTPILDRVVPQLMDDAALRGAIAEQATRQRLARWPIVNIVDAVLGPVLASFRRGPSASGSTRQNVRAIVDDLVPPLDAAIRATFAEVRRRDASVADVYGASLPWNDRESDSNVAVVTARLADAMDARRQRGVAAIGRGHGAALAPLRWLLTLGAVLWFPFVQPVLAIVLDPSWTWTGLTQAAVWQIVKLLGSTYLLQSVTFLAVYFFGLWATLRFLTLRRVEYLAARAAPDDSLNAADQPATIAEAWVDELLAPLAARSAELARLVERLDAARDATRAA